MTDTNITAHTSPLDNNEATANIFLRHLNLEEVLKSIFS